MDKRNLSGGENFLYPSAEKRNSLRAADDNAQEEMETIMHQTVLFPPGPVGSSTGQHPVSLLGWSIAVIGGLALWVLFFWLIGLI